jgi:uncharacterized protein
MTEDRGSGKTLNHQGPQRPSRHRLAMLGVLALAVVAASGMLLGTMLHKQPTDPDHVREIETWRRQRLARLVSDEGWLVVAGLFWLKDGPNRFGSDPGSDIVLPDHSAPSEAGVFYKEGQRVTVEVLPGVDVSTASGPVSRQELRSDVQGPPDVLALGDLRLFLIDREERLGVRLRDLRSPRRTEFQGLEYFPISAAYRVTARFVPHPVPKTLELSKVGGSVARINSPGSLHFRLGDRDLSLDVLLETPDTKYLYIIFRDQTAGKESYGAGRFLYTGLPREGEVLLDFNKAFTPPCGFSPYAVCPLPPPQNRLPVTIEAGEKFKAAH